MLADGRVLGSGGFVERVVSDAQEQVRAQVLLLVRAGEVEATVAEACEESAFRGEELDPGGAGGWSAH
jgi:hypothetical protein